MPGQNILILCPLQQEYEYLRKSFIRHGLQPVADQLGMVKVSKMAPYGLTLARGGLGKVQFAVQTQYLIDHSPGLDLVICTGAAGSLAQEVSAGDIVVGTHTVEHDIHNFFGNHLMPKFTSPTAVVKSFRNTASKLANLKVHFGPIASGDEDVVDTKRKSELHKMTSALAVAWEGAGGARACKYSGVPFIEIRGISDSANQMAVIEFIKNLKWVMGNLGILISTWVNPEIN